eukprot:TRINITY_DN3253_c0_g2_i1.p1 TRINITY_DN3253_c0_g2~~TRINITY_DN3253_c0_g2_i1.p1  ORF type:complete len:196 (+),score=43.96 TRINITY_DN3253_c0_g2_i1:18-605(+)
MDPEKDEGHDEAYDPGKKASIKELMSKDTEDESLRKYKEALLGKEAYAPKDDPRKCVILKFEILFESRPGGNLEFKTDTKEELEVLSKKGFTLKEGCHYKTRITFRVQHEILSGLKMLTVVKKGIIPVAKDSEMLGSYRPQKDLHIIENPRRGWEEAPAGALARGQYKASVNFVDDDKTNHLEFHYTFKIGKDWD